MRWITQKEANLQGAEFQNRNGLIDSAEKRVRFAKDLRGESWTIAVGQENLTRARNTCPSSNRHASSQAAG